MAMQSLAIIIIVLAVFLIAGVPISYAIGISALAAILQMVSLDVSVLTAAQRTFVGMSKFSLTAIPFFVLAGNLMNQGGIAKRLVDFVLAILGKLPGALLVTNVGANALFGAISGSASAAAAAAGAAATATGAAALTPNSSSNAFTSSLSSTTVMFLISSINLAISAILNFLRIIYELIILKRFTPFSRRWR